MKIASPRKRCERVSVYRVEYAKGVTKDLKPLPKKVRARALEVVENILATDPYQGKPLAGTYQGLHRFRVADDHIVSSIEREKLTIFALRIRDRKDAYRGIV